MNATDTLKEMRGALRAACERLDERHAADLDFRARSRKSRTNHARRLGLDGAEPKSPLGGEQPAGELPENSQAEPLRRMPRQPQRPRGPAMEQLKVEVKLLLVDELLKHSAVADVKGMEVAIAIVRANARLKMENPLHQQAAREYGEQFLSELSARHAVKKARGEAGCQPWREEV
ncbi:MAG TPA: hypothetical protein VJ476_08875, partial [Rhizomicrobium sp.]|nr:hypothetical protein [Rhizomicrobium sp.]